MLFKMLGIERAWETHRATMPKPRQLFVTQSRVLAEKVEEYFAKLLESLASAGRSLAELRDLAERQRNREEQGLVDRDEEIYWRGDLPKRYGALKEEHFPMFLTYDHVRLVVGCSRCGKLMEPGGRSAGCWRASSSTWSRTYRRRRRSRAASRQQVQPRLQFIALTVCRA